MTLRTEPGTYAFNNDDVAAADRHLHLAGLLDQVTRSRLAALPLAGARCLEVGAGGGSIARWLADQVGPTGAVTATDLNVRHLPTDAGFQVLAHDLTTDPLPAGPWDLIHARLVLIHLPQPHEVMRRLAAGLAPGGALLLEEFDSTFGASLLAAADTETTRRFNTYYPALREILAAGGNDLRWPGQMHAAMLAEGLVDVDTRYEARAWPGGTPGAQLHVVNIHQVRTELRAAGLTDDDLDQLLAALQDPRTVVRGLITVSTLGRRPQT